MSIIARYKEEFKNKIISWDKKSDEILITRKNILIFPAKSGLMIALMIFVMLIISINYQLNLGYLLTFSLLASAFVSMVLSHENIRGLSMRLDAPDIGFIGSNFFISVKIKNDTKLSRHGVRISTSGDREYSNRDDITWADVDAMDESDAKLAINPSVRGYLSLPVLVVETKFPIGSFVSWSYWSPSSRVLIAPKIEVNAPKIPFGNVDSEGVISSKNSNSSDEVDGVRAYQRGDLMKRIVWKKAASSGELIIRDTSIGKSSEVWLDRDLTRLTDTESQLSRLCAWIIMADKSGLIYGLRLGDIKINPSKGDSHRIACLKILALY